MKNPLEVSVINVSTVLKREKRSNNKNTKNPKNEYHVNIQISHGDSSLNVTERLDFKESLLKDMLEFLTFLRYTKDYLANRVTNLRIVMNTYVKY
mgnify:CR=1 FL=1